MNIGDPITEIKTGDTGRVVRVCDVTGWFFVTLDKHAEDRVYRNYEHGPLIERELKTIGG